MKHAYQVKHAYIVYIHDYAHGPITDDNMIVCDESNLVFAINKMLDKNNGKCVCIKRCELIVEEEPDMSFEFERP